MSTDRHRLDGEGGFTLIEVLVTMTIMLVVFAIFAGGLGLAIFGADVNNRQATAATAVKTAAESVTYIKCASSAQYQAQLPSAPTGFTWVPPEVTYWNGSAFVSSCPSPDEGLQLIKLEVTSTRALPNSDSGQQQVVGSTLEVVKRDPKPNP